MSATLLKRLRERADYEVHHEEMDSPYANLVREAHDRIEQLELNSSQAWLGLATSAELLTELQARAEIHGWGTYRTVDEPPECAGIDDERTQSLNALLREIDARPNWQARIQYVGVLKCYTANARVFLVEEYSGNAGFEIFIPASTSNLRSTTFDALRAYVGGQQGE